MAELPKNGIHVTAAGEGRPQGADTSDKHTEKAALMDAYINGMANVREAQNEQDAANQDVVSNEARRVTDMAIQAIREAKSYDSAVGKAPGTSPETALALSKAMDSLKQIKESHPDAYMNGLNDIAQAIMKSDALRPSQEDFLRQVKKLQQVA